MKTDFERRVAARGELRFDDTKGNRIVGKIPYNSPSENLGGFKEIIRAGAFADAIRNDPSVALLIEHTNLPLARHPGTMQLRDMPDALHFSATVDREDPDVLRVIPKLKRGDLRGLSFSMIVDKPGGERWTKGRNGELDVREILRVRRFAEISLVTFPAYQSTEVALRSWLAWRGETFGGSAIQPPPKPRRRRFISYDRRLFGCG